MYEGGILTSEGGILTSEGAIKISESAILISGCSIPIGHERAWCTRGEGRTYILEGQHYDFWEWQQWCISELKKERTKRFKGASTFPWAPSPNDTYVLWINLGQHCRQRDSIWKMAASADICPGVRERFQSWVCVRSSISTNSSSELS